MNLVDYYKSISNEMLIMKDRIRQLIKNSHWLTDGEWKESILRTVLKRHLPSNLGVGRGFVLTTQGSSKQIDVLIYDKNYPIIFKDGDLVFIEANAVRGIVEVKSTGTNDSLNKGFESLCANAECINLARTVDRGIFVGFFAFDSSENVEIQILEKLQKNTKEKKERIINHVCIGEKKFIKYWESSPRNEEDRINYWASYNLNNSSIAYFIGNLIKTCMVENTRIENQLWFQFKSDNYQEGKESVREEIKSLKFENR